MSNERISGTSLYMRSMAGLANVIALAAVFFGAPLIYDWTIAAVTAYAVAHYGPYTVLTAWFWGALCGFGVFYLSRTFLSFGVVLTTIGLALRFLV